MGRTLQALHRAPWLMEVSILVMRKKSKSEGPKFPAQTAWQGET